MRIMTIYGTRPEAIKVAPVIKAIEADPELENIIVSTGQHREMLSQVNALFEIQPDIDLDIMADKQTLNEIVAKVVQGVDAAIERERPDAVLVQGDTSTVLAAAVAAFNRKVPVVHLEAGLRSGKLMSPFPEEANRRVVSELASLHLAPTKSAAANLRREGHKKKSIVVTGNTVIDALLAATKRDTVFTDPKLEELKAKVSAGSRILLVTTHRRENLGSKMEHVGEAIAELAERYPDLIVVLPIHRNPLVRSAVLPHVEGRDNILVTEPLDYAEFTKLLGLAHIVLTDSGGVQEEAPSLGKPVLVLRKNTERPEAVSAGTVRLVGTKKRRIVKRVAKLLDSEVEYQAMSRSMNPYGDGAAAPRAVAAIKNILFAHLQVTPKEISEM